MSINFLHLTCNNNNMKQKQSSWILYGIIATIAITIVVQVYWNYKNYQVNKQQFINQVQISLDNSVEAYYADLAKNKKVMFVSMEAKDFSFPKASNGFQYMDVDTILKRFGHSNYKHSDTIIIDASIEGFSEYSKETLDSMFFTAESTMRAKLAEISRNDQKYKDSLRLLKEVSSLYISISERFT